MRIILVSSAAAVVAGYADSAADTNTQQETTILDFPDGNPRVNDHDGDVDGREPVPGTVFTAAPGDRIVVTVSLPAGNLIGKKVKFDAIPKFRVEYKEGCRKKIDDQELPAPHTNTTSLTIGKHIRVLVLRTRLADGEDLPPLEATPETPVRVTVNEPQQFRVRLEYNEEDVVFAKRPLTRAEYNLFVEPVEKQYKSLANIVGFRVANDEVLPGNVGALKVTFTATRPSAK